MEINGLVWHKVENNMYITIGHIYKVLNPLPQKLLDWNQVLHLKPNHHCLCPVMNGDPLHSTNTPFQSSDNSDTA
jgi:hypothetical protein